MQFQKAKAYIAKRQIRDLPKHLFYHCFGHIEDVYKAATGLAFTETITGRDLKLLLTAVMYHDCGFMIQANHHEALSCAIAKESLPKFGYTTADIEMICGMIMATRLPQTPHNLLEQVICDADLDYLGRDDFFIIGDRLFKEFLFYGIVKDEMEWDQLQIRFLETHHYFTQTAINTRQAKKQQHLLLLKENISAKINY